jgi:hypothetical protein
MYRRALVLVIAAVWTAVVGAAETIRIENATGTPGQTNLLVRVLIDHSKPLYAMSFAVKYPTAGLTFKQVTLAETVFTGAAAPEYFQQISGTDYCGAAILIDAENVLTPYAEKTLPAGTGQFAVGLYFDVKPTAQCGDSFAIDLRNDIGAPVIDPVFTVVEIGSISKSVLPTLTDGAVTVSVAPSVTSVSPTRGAKEGGTAITITGQNFTTATTVTLGGLALTSPRVVNAPSITGTTKAHAVGAVDLVVTTACGTDTAAAAFTYFGQEPLVAEVTPRWGQLAGGTDVVVTGENFDAATTITFAGAAIQNKSFVNATTITGKTPAHAVAGLVNVVAANGSGSSTRPDGFGYAGSPTIDSLTPATGTGDVDVVVQGSGFTEVADMTVLLGGSPIETFEVASSDVLMFRVPACGGISGWRGLSLFTSVGNATLAQAYNCGGGVVFKRGDANCDGAFDIADAIAILGYLFSSKTVKCLDALNANDSASVDIADAVYLLGYLFTHGPQPPAPFAAPGTDTTPDNVECAESCVKA